MSQEGSIYFRHGSPDSTDLDFVYIFKTNPSNSECNKFLANFPDQDVNIITIKNNQVATSYRGLVDETNNALIATVKHHKQDFEFPITRPLTRIVPLKVCDTILSICVILRKHSQYRDDMIEILSSFDFEKRRKYLMDVSFCKVTLSIEEIKFLAFRLGQTLCLLRGKQVYTKSEVSEEIPELESLLKRIETRDACKILDIYLKKFLGELVGVKVLRKGTLHIFWNEKEIGNHYQAQSRGMVIDIESEKLVYFPWCHLHDMNCDWAIDSISKILIPKKIFFVFNDGSNTFQFTCEGDLFEKVKHRKLEENYFHIFKTKEDLLFKRNRYTLLME